MECQQETALDVIRGPQVAGIGSCGMQGQATMAETGLGQRKDEYIKIRCEGMRELTTASTH